MKKLTWMLCFSFIFLGCSESGEDLPEKDVVKTVVKSTLTGKIEKGPFLTGSKITLYELDGDLKQTGRNIFKTETTNDNGDFIFDSKMELSSQFVELEISGYFFNEVNGSNSTSQITLNALADVSGKNKVNVNILTHLVYKRIKVLVAEGMTFASAQKQAHKELLSIFYITKEVKNADDIGLADGNEDAAILLAISAVLLYDKREADFSEFIAKLSNDFASDGMVSDNGLVEKIRHGQKNVNSLQVMGNLKSYYSEKGKSVEIDNIRQFIDSNVDGILDDKDAVFEGTQGEDISSDSQFGNEEAIEQMMSTTYAQICSYYERILVLDAVRGKLTTHNEFIGANNTTLSEAWSKAYRSIRYLNLIIENVVSQTSIDAKPYLYTSKVLRALVYLDMVQHWGDLIYLTKSFTLGESFPGPTAKKEILSALLIDLKESVPYLGEQSVQNTLFVSKDLANALMGIILLEQKEYSEASAYFEKIIGNGNAPSVASTIYSDVNNKEALFSLLFMENYQPFQVFDQYLRKGTLHPLHRKTGVFLHYAESLAAANRGSDLLSILNKIRVSGNKNPLPELPAKPAYEIANLWKEFIGADYGYFDLLKRLGLAVELLQIIDYQQLYPIPIQELQLNPNIRQNPGY